MLIPAPTGPDIKLPIRSKTERRRLITSIWVGGETPPVSETEVTEPEIYGKTQEQAMKYIQCIRLPDIFDASSAYNLPSRWKPHDQS